MQDRFWADYYTAQQVAEQNPRSKDLQLALNIQSWLLKYGEKAGPEFLQGVFAGLGIANTFLSQQDAYKDPLKVHQQIHDAVVEAAHLYLQKTEHSITLKYPQDSAKA